MAYIYARAIYAGKKTLEDVPARWKEPTKAAYLDLYGVPLGE